MARRTYKAHKGTSFSTVVGPDGETVAFEFNDEGTYTTSDDRLIAVLDVLARTEGHPIDFAPGSKPKE